MTLDTGYKNVIPSYRILTPLPLMGRTFKIYMPVHPQIIDSRKGINEFLFDITASCFTSSASRLVIGIRDSTGKFRPNFNPESIREHVGNQLPVGLVFILCQTDT